MSQSTENLSSDDERRFVVDAAYLRQQAREAVQTFFAPVIGVLDAAIGIERHRVRPASTAHRPGARKRRARGSKPS